jgi:hypothetical protein
LKALRVANRCVPDSNHFIGAIGSVFGDQTYSLSDIVNSTCLRDIEHGQT